MQRQQIAEMMEEIGLQSTMAAAIQVLLHKGMIKVGKHEPGIEGMVLAWIETFNAKELRALRQIAEGLEESSVQ